MSIKNKKKTNNQNELFVDNKHIFPKENNSEKELFVDNKYVFPKENNKRKFIQLLTLKNLLRGISVLMFIFVIIEVINIIYLRKTVEFYEGFFDEIEEKESLETVISNDKNNYYDDFKMGAAMELVNCIKKPIDTDKIPSSINNIIKEINNYYNKSNNYFAFKYKDIYTGFSVSYNEGQKIFTASTIKAPKDIYLYEMASLGKINLDDKLKYTGDYYNNGTGVLKNKKTNTSYTVRELISYSTIYSDNAAHNMLMDKFGRDNMLNFWSEKGTNAIFTQNTNWGVLNAHDAVIYMEELYKFYIENDDYGKELMNNFLGAKTKFIRGKNGYKVANKSGWSGSSIHDVSIIFADNPYIVVALSNLGNTDGYQSYFNKVNDLAYRLHTEYWKVKMDMCSNIVQY